jgi:hypothetical protein
VAGWNKGRALVLAFLAVVALAVAFGRPSAGAPTSGNDERGGVFAAGLAIGPENATVRNVDEGGPRRGLDGRPGRLLPGLFLAVLTAVAATTVGSRRWRERCLRGPLELSLGHSSRAPRAPPVVVRPL